MPKNNARFIAKQKALIKQKSTEKQKAKTPLAKIKRTVTNPKFWLSAGMIASALAAAVLLKKHLESLSRITAMQSQLQTVRGQLESVTERYNNLAIESNNRSFANANQPREPHQNPPRPNQPTPSRPNGRSGFGEERFGGLDYDSMPRDLKKLLVKLNRIKL